MHMLLFVLDDPNKLDQVLNAWESIGVTGVTILESTGINRHKQHQLAGKAFMAGINRLMQYDEEGHYTLFTIVKGADKVRACIEITETVVGNLKEPNTGVIAAWPVGIVKGVPNPELDTED